MGLGDAVSRYAIDKVMREAVQRPAAREAFVANPQLFLEGRDLTDAERAALIGRDYPALYLLGAHPFLLVGFVGCLSPPEERFATMDAYQKSLANLGYPDFST
jgi:hypothetical protein